MLIKRFSLILLTCIGWRIAMLAGGLCNLKVEYEQTPLGIDVAKPWFSWQMETDAQKRGQHQKAFQIIVSADGEGVVWDSGRQPSAASLNVVYAGKTIKPQTRYQWTVRVWNEHDALLESASWFETGLMDTSLRAWDGARWIGAPADSLVLYSHYLPVFRLAYTLQLDEKSRSTRASFIYGANDPRLSSANMNIYGLKNVKDSSFIRLELDTHNLDNGGQAQLRLFRQGYSTSDKKGVALAVFNVPLSLINASNRYEPHRFLISSNLGTTDIYVDNTAQPVGSALVNPLGKGGDFVAFPVVGDLGFMVSKGQTASLSAVEVLNYRSPANRIALVGKLNFSKKSGFFATVNPSQCAMPMLRCGFTVERKVATARLYATARGVYDVYINGQRIGNDYLNPGFTQYDKTQLYQTFDVTEMLQSGRNAIGAVLGEGWWSGNLTYIGENWNYFGDRQSFLAKLVITFSDGTKQILTTNPDTWRCFTDGPYTYGSLFQGEVFDARKAETIAHWACGDYNDSAWINAAEICTDGTTSHDGWDLGPSVDDYSACSLISQLGNTIKKVATLTAKTVSEVRPGVFVYDMGQNFAGVPEIDFNGLQPGQHVTMRYAEVTYPDLPEYKKLKGMLMLENIRTAMATDVYTAKGGKERFSPRFTYHGYRYIEITGLTSALPVESVRGVVLSSIHDMTAAYSTSDSLVNRLWQNIGWSAMANFFSVPTDCPQRNERLGWAGDISVFSRTATYLSNSAQFLRSYLRSMRDVQGTDGRLPDIAPLGGGFGGFLWGSAGITVPWECFMQYADTTMLREHYGAMKRYMDYVATKYIDPESRLIVQERQWGDLGDWLGLEDSKNDKSLLWECYYIYDLGLMAKIAEVLGQRDDAQHYSQLRDERKRFFQTTYLDADGGTIASAFLGDRKGQPIDTQTSYVLALASGAVEGDMQARVAKKLANTIERENLMDNGQTAPRHSLMTGFIGTAWISKALSDNGYTDLAYLLLQNTDYPSWLYPVTQGATTIWERLNSYTLKDGFGGNNRMNSFNHYSFGAVGSWMLNYSLGITRSDECPGFQRFILQPQPDPTGTMTSARGHYDSMYGRIESSWLKTETGVEYCFTVPANTQASVVLPASSLKQVSEGGRRLKKGTYSATENKSQGTVNMTLESGSYHFVVKSAQR